MKAIIIEDETLIARELKNKIAAVAPYVTITETLSSVKTANRWLMEKCRTGFCICRHTTERRCKL